MSKRFAWLLGMAVLVLIGLLVACGSTYNSAFDGLVLVSSQGSGLLETFSFNLNSGSIFAVNNPPSDTANLTCVLNGLPSSIVVDPAGAYAYTIITANQSVCGPNSTATGIAAFKINSDGTMKAVGSLVPDPNPIQLVMDSTGKFLFVAEGPNGTVNAYAISGPTLTLVPGTFNFALPPGAGFQPPDFSAVAVTPMVWPPVINGVQQAVCSSPGNSRPTSEFLYAADAANNVVWEFSVDTSTGALGNPPNATQVPYFPSPAIPSTGPPLAVPSGVAVDPCDRFVYVANNLQNNISAYTICNGTMTQSSSCTAPDGSLRAVGSPFVLTGGANGPGPMTVDPFGNTLYVLDTLSNQVSILRISRSGSLTSSSQVPTGLGPTSLAIRSDNSWLFVANFQAGTLSQYSITPSTGALAASAVTTTDNYPWGVAVK